ncbi:MAG: histidine--tRNA ligase [Patescibacteria group bacterium]
MPQVKNIKKIKPVKKEKDPVIKVMASPKSNEPLQLVRGFKDILPSDKNYWSFLYGKFSDLALAHGFDMIETPIVENANLFIRAVGKQTDIVDKEMFVFEDRGGERVALRPEGTAGVARAYISHGMLAEPQPVKLWYYGPMFRYERPQSGRLREFHQVGFEVMGDINPIIDAQLMIFALGFFHDLGLGEATLQVNSIGCPKCREKFKEALVEYYRASRPKLCEDCKKRLLKNPLRILDCKNESCASLKSGAPQIVDWLDEECKNHFTRVLEYLDSANVGYVLNPYLVRGLDYYTRTVFEIWPGEEDRGQNTLCGGGRFDGLLELLGGRAAPAIGMAVGVERVITQLREKGVQMPTDRKPDVFVAALGEPAKKRCLQLFEELRRAGIMVSENFSRDGLKHQLESSNKIGARYTIILGQKEVSDGTIIIRDMDSGVQEVVDYSKITSELRKKLNKSYS